MIKPGEPAHRIDPSFKARREIALKARQTKRRRRLLSLGIAGAAAFVMIFAAYPFIERMAHLGNWWSGPALEEHADDDVMPVYTPPIVDLPGEPLFIELGAGQQISAHEKTLAISPDLQAFGLAGSVELVSGPIQSSSSELMLTVPSSQRDFAYFQAQRSEEKDPTGTPTANASAAPQSSPAPQDTVDNVSIGQPVPASERRRMIADTVLKIAAPMAVQTFLTDQGVSPVTARFAADAMANAFNVSDLSDGMVLAMRFLERSPGNRQLVQLALYSSRSFIGALAIEDDGSYVPAVDPWAAKDLLQHAAEPPVQMINQRYRLIDGIYSAAIRDGATAEVAGEAIMYLSRKFDLTAYMTGDESIALAYQRDPRKGGQSLAHIVYVGIQGKNSDIHCYVMPVSDGFGCFDDKGGEIQADLSGRMVLPVNGMVASGFGPRMNPSTKRVEPHDGIDWTAPAGTPIKAAFAGTITFAGERDGFGKMIEISHSGNRKTLYAHISRFADDLAEGRQIAAGAVIGYTGIAGRASNPPLFFALTVNDKAVDPLAAGDASSSGDDNVARLVDQIVHVESGGKADAKNPYSTATGLGQFIESTWLRMMRTYRPDLSRSLPVPQLLALRTDPTLAREMVGNLARENEDYLRGRGHTINPARLYLAHFLGPQGANIVLGASDTTSLQSLLGDKVIAQNPFLAGKTVSFINKWVEQVMSGHRGRPTAPPTLALPPRFAAFREAVDGLLSLTGS